MSLLMSNIDMHIEHLSQYTSTPGKGVTRVVYSEEDKKAKSYIKKIMDSLLLDVQEDEIGNLFGTWKGIDSNLPQIWTGSHIDAPTNGGKFDGVVGVVGALESIRILKENEFQPQRDIVVVVFASEEPTRFGIGCLGSRALIGMINESDLDSWIDDTNCSLRQVLSNEEKDPTLVLTQQLNAEKVKTFVEMHIEQAAVLEKEKATILILLLHQLKSFLKSMVNNGTLEVRPWI